MFSLSPDLIHAVSPLLKSASRIHEIPQLTMWRAHIPSSWRLGSSWPSLARTLRVPTRKRSLLGGGSTAAGTIGSEKTKTTALALGGGVTFALVSVWLAALLSFLTSERPESIQ